MCNWTKNICQPSDVSEVILQKFIGDIIEPCIIWKAGRSSESLRSMAVSALCCASQGAEQETKRLFPNYVTHFIGLLDDNSVVTRGHTLRCLLNCGPLKIECLKSIAFGVLARLDDPSAEVRQYAAQVIGQLELDEINENDVEIWQNCVPDLMARLILHLDNPEIKLQTLLLGNINTFHSLAMVLSIFFFLYIQVQLKALLSNFQIYLVKLFQQYQNHHVNFKQI